MIAAWPYWFELAVAFGVLGCGNILLEPFARHRSKARRVAKLLVVAALAVCVSAALGRGWFLALCGVAGVLVLLVHAWWLPRHGVNGWTGEPREKLEALLARGKLR